MSQDGWPDANEFPYLALIRIRCAHELDLEVLQIVQGAMTRTLAPEVAADVIRTITSAAARVAIAGADAPIPVEKSEQGFAAFREVMFDDDLCPPWWRWPWPPPPPWQRFSPSPDPWRRFGPGQPDPWHGISPVAGVRVLTSARAALAALADRGAAEQIGAAIDAALNQLAG